MMRRREGHDCNWIPAGSIFSYTRSGRQRSVLSARQFEWSREQVRHVVDIYSGDAGASHQLNSPGYHRKGP